MTNTPKGDTMKAAMVRSSSKIVDCAINDHTGSDLAVARLHKNCETNAYLNMGPVQLIVSLATPLTADGV